MPPTEKQLTLFDAFFSPIPEQSRTIDVWDALPKFVLTHARDNDGTNLIEFNNVNIDGHPIKLAISAAILSSSSKPGDKDATKRSRVVFPGVREELVERALRKMAIQRQIEARLEADDKQQPVFPIVFTLSQLRAELAAAGHELMISQLREALDVLGNSTLRPEGLIEDELNGFSHPLLLVSYKRKRGDKSGEHSYYKARFHPLAVRAILAGAWQPINYARVMRLSLPLARWIATRINNRFRSAAKHAALKKHGYYLTLSRILAESGIRPENRLRDTLERIHRALDELKRQGFLDLGKPYDEEITYERTAGRPKIAEVRWTLFPSNSFAEEIIQGNIELQPLKNSHVPEAPPQLLGVESAKPENRGGVESAKAQSKGE